LQALDEFIIGREVGGWNCKPRAKSDIYYGLVVNANVDLPTIYVHLYIADGNSNSFLSVYCANVRF